MNGADCVIGSRSLMDGIAAVSAETACAVSVGVSEDVSVLSVASAEVSLEESVAAAVFAAFCLAVASTAAVWIRCVRSSRVSNRLSLPSQKDE